MHGQKASPASNLGVLVSRVDGQNPKSSSDRATQIHANLKKTQHVSPFSRDANNLRSKAKLASPLNQEAKKSWFTGQPSSEDIGKTGMTKDESVASRTESPNPASSFSHDENEAPEYSSVRLRSKAESQQVEMTRTKAAATQGKMSVKNLNRNLCDASTVMQEERASSIGSASSSLSVDELSGIAMHALKASREEEKRTKVVSSKLMGLTRASPILQKKYPETRQLRSNENAGQEKSISEKTKSRTAAIPHERNAATKTKDNEDLSDTENQHSGLRSSCPITMNTSTVNNTKKKSRMELYDAARKRAASRSPSPVMMHATTGTRQRPGSRSPSPVTMSATTSNTVKQSSPVGVPLANLSKKDSRLAILSAGRRRIEASSTDDSFTHGQSRSERLARLAAAYGQSPVPKTANKAEKSLETVNSASEDGSVISTDDSFSHGQSRSERMARLAAAHRQSPIPKTANKAIVSTTSKALTMRKSMSTAKASGTSANTRHARMSKLASHRSASPLFSPTESKNESTNGKGTQNSSSKLATHADITAAKAVESRTPEESDSKSVLARCESFEKSASSSSNGPVKSQKASPSGSVKSLQVSPNGPFNAEKASPHGLFQTQKASSNEPFQPQRATPKRGVQSQKASPNEAMKLDSASSQGERTRTASAVLHGQLSASGLGSPPVSDHQALHAKEVALPVRFADTTSCPKRKLRDGVQKPIGRPIENAFLGNKRSEEKPQQHDASSNTSNSHGCVKGAVDACSSKSKETSQERPALASPRERGDKVSPKAKDYSAFDRTTGPQGPEAAYHDFPGSYGARSREDRSTMTRGTKQSEGSRSAFEETKTISSEITVGGSPASTFISSPSSYASSKMSAGAPGSFFRPMETVNDFEETSKDHILLGQLSVESTDVSESPSHLFKSLSSDGSKSGDSHLSFLLEQMQSEDETEDNGIKLLSSKGRPIQKEARLDNNDQAIISTFSGRYHILSYSEDTPTLGTTENDKSTLLGQSLLNEESRSSDTSDSHVIKWWQNTDPLERRKKFESKLSEKALKPSVAATNLFGMATARRDSDDLFNGLSNDASEFPDPIDCLSDDVFAGMTPSFETVHSSLTPNKNHTALPPPPPAPPLETTHQYGTILLHGSQVIDSVSSDITSSVLVENVSKDQIDWARRESTAVIKEELTAELEEEEKTVEEVLSEARQKEESVHTGNSHSAKDSVPGIKEALPVYAGVPRADDEASGFVSETKPLKSDSIFMALGQKILDAFPQCWAPGKLHSLFSYISGKLMLIFRGFSSSNHCCIDADGVLNSFDLEGAETHSIMADSQSLTQSTMNDYERKVWDDWDKQDSKPGTKDEASAGITGATEVIEHFMPEVAKHSPEVVARSPQFTERLPSDVQRSPGYAENNQGCVEQLHDVHQKLMQCAKTMMTSDNDMESEPSTEESTLESVLSLQCIHQDLQARAEEVSRIVPTLPSPPPLNVSPPLTLSQSRILEKFSSTMKRHGMEVLKLNRDKKWQTRFLTVSKEVLWVKPGDVNGHYGDRAQCPLGILWMKRFNAAKDYSVSAVGRQGRGGVLCDQLVKVSATGCSNVGHSLNKKQQNTFKFAVAVNLTYSACGVSKSVFLLCKSTDAAHFLCTGLRVLMDALQRENNSSQEGKL
jgi:hypothetical protein